MQIRENPDKCLLCGLFWAEVYGVESVPEHTVDKMAETGKKAGKSGKNSDGKAAGKFICKTICQYSKEPVSDEDMKKLIGR